MTRTFLPAALTVALLAPLAAALPFQNDTLAPGISSGGSRSVGEFDACATLPDGNRVVFDGIDIRLVQDDGTTIALLGTSARYGFPAFVVPNPSATFALVAESSAGRIRRAELDGSGTAFLTHLDFAYDAAFEDATHVLVSAAPCGFNCGSEIYRIDVLTGAQTLVAAVAGPSGPVAIGAGGDLFYGLQSSAFPPQPVPILRWTKAQVDGGAVLHEADATTFVAGLNAPASMKFDPVSGHLIVADSPYQATSRILEYSAAGLSVGTIVESSKALAGIELLRTAGNGSFGAFQPRGVDLKYRWTDFSGNTSEIRTLRPRRPRATMSGPGLSGPGAVTFHVSGAYPSASLIVVVGLASTYDPSEPAHDFGTFLLHTGIDLAHARRLATIATDANGDASFTYQNPGGLEGTRMFQGWIRDGNGILVGTSNSVSN
jgi:hypothetical protein